MNEISDSFKMQWLNVTLKFVKSNNLDVIKYPEMPLSHVQYLQNLIRKNEFLFDHEFNALHAPLWKAMKLYSWKVVINKGDRANTGQIILEKVDKVIKDKTELENDKFEYLSISFARNLTNTKSNKPKKPKREKPFFLANREMMESVSGTILKTSLQKILHFINAESEASIIFTDLEKMEARFFQIFVLITMRYKLFESLLSPGCCDLFNKICKKFEEKTVKLVVRGPIINKWTKKSEIIFTKAPIYGRIQLKPTNTSENNANDQKPVDTLHKNSLNIESKKSLLQVYHNNTISEDINKDDPQTKLMKSIERIGNSDNFNDDFREPYNDIVWKTIDGNNIQTKQLSNTENIENSNNSNCDRNIENSSILNDDKTNNDIVLEDEDSKYIQTKKSSSTENTESSDNCNNGRPYNDVVLENEDSKYIKTKQPSSIENKAKFSDSTDDRSINDYILKDEDSKNKRTNLTENVQNIDNSTNLNDDRPINYAVLKDVGKVIQTKRSNGTESTKNSGNSDCNKTNNYVVLEDVRTENTHSNLTRRKKSIENCDNTNVDRSHNNLHLDDVNKVSTQDQLTRSIENMEVSNNLNSLSNVAKNNATKIYYTVEEATRDINKCKSRPLPNHIVFTKADGRQKEETARDLKQNDIEKLIDYWCPRIVKLLEDLSVPLESERGLRIMRSMGWTGGALGLRGNGITDPILPVLDRKRREGLGHKSTKSVLDQTEIALCNFILENILEMIEYDKSITVIPYTRILTKREMDYLMFILKSLNNRFNADVMFPEGVERDLANKVLEQMFLEPNVSVDIEFSGYCEVIILKRKYNSEKPETKKKKKKVFTETTLLEHYNLCSMTIRLTPLDDFKMIIVSQILYLLKSNDRYNIYLNFNNNLKSVHYGFVNQACASFNNKQVIGCRLTKELEMKVVDNIGDNILGVDHGKNGQSIAFTKVKMKSTKELEDCWKTI